MVTALDAAVDLRLVAEFVVAHKVLANDERLLAHLALHVLADPDEHVVMLALWDIRGKQKERLQN